MSGAVPQLGQLILRLMATLAAASILFSAWAISSPVGSSADETFHLTAIWCGDRTGGEFCERDSDDAFARSERYKEFLVPAYVADGLSCIAGNVGASAACQLSKNANQKEAVYLGTTFQGYGSYPGLFYEFAKRFVDANTSASVLRIRIANGLIASTFLVLALGLQTIAARSRYFGLSILSVLTPPVLFLIPSVNPTSWVLIGVSIAALGVQNLLDTTLTSGARAFSLICVVGSCVLALGARQDSGLWLASILVCILVVRLRSTSFYLGDWLYRQRKRCLVALTISVTAITLIATSPWTIRRFVEFHEPIEGPQRTWWRILLNNVLSLPDFLIGFVGGGTWNIAAHQRFVVPPLVIICSLALLIITLRASWRTTSFSSRLSAVLVALLGIAWILVIHQANSYYIGKQVQPRYFMPVFIAAVFLLGRDSTARPTQRASFAITGIMTIGHALLFYQHLRRYIIGLREWTNDDLGCLACPLRPLEWWWALSGVPSPELVWATGSIAYCLLTWLLLRHPRLDRQQANLSVGSSSSRLETKESLFHKSFIGH